MSDIQKIKISSETEEIIARFEAAGFEAFLVGGSLRDSLLGADCGDVDLTTSALPEETMALFSDMRIIPTGLKHGTVTLMTASGTPIEITTYRTDGEYSDSRHPDSVSFTRNLSEDLSRRDFTVNAMAYAPQKGIVDLFDGRYDLERKLIRCVGDPVLRFSEDALRILRAFRFSAQLGFDIDKNTLDGAVAMAKGLHKIARERVAVEMLKLLSAPLPSSALGLMSPVLPDVFPDITIDSSRFSLCDALPRDPIARLSLLIFGSGQAHAMAHSLKLSNADKGRLIALSELADSDIPSSPFSARKLLCRFQGAHGDSLTAVRIWGLVNERDVSDALDLVWEQISAAPCLTLSMLAVNGKDLISEGLASGKDVGRILSVLLQSVIADPSANNRDKLMTLARSVAEELCK